ncbi:MAG TPA: DUF4855 domain-containing protein [Chitinophaga sp.]|uniref:DUF4855 domain-containing protein n=1 Tax=Chitinophaga sp. TaxID=1869181 RepID=UPI002D12D6FF|nr:DUF4855 domain-containing protein [Chitinophaga sp.]HVI45841.1 DUF4855 domain-containing protein [Chitinophaga sp.]
MQKLTCYGLAMAFSTGILLHAIISCSPDVKKTIEPVNASTSMTAARKPVSPLSYMSDMALIYQGGTHRLPWYKDQLAPYIYRSTAAGVQYLFDGFLFIEFKDNLGHEYAEGYEPLPAGKAEWAWLLDRNFEKGKAIDALDGVLDSLIRLNITPKRKRKVILTLPEPIRKLTDWGELNGRTLNFQVAADRIAACKWYMDLAEQKWQAAGLKHLELAGFYWVAEQNTGAVEILPDVAADIHNRNLKFYWIPYYGAAGADNWKAMGFDVAYQQPNYFFDTQTPYSILTGAISFAQQHKMALEMEFDTRVVTDTAYRSRYTAYIDEFQKQGIWNGIPVAYYEGGHGWLDMYNSNDTAVKRLFNRLADIVVKRQY